MESLNLKVGETVWCLLYGKGVVGDIGTSNEDYPVRVDHAEGGSDYYTVDGKHVDDGARMLYFSEPKIDALTERPMPRKVVRYFNLYAGTGSLVGKIVVGMQNDSVEAAEESAKNSGRVAVGRARLEAVEGVFEV